MTIHKLLLTTAMASVTAVAAQADNQDVNAPEPEREATVDVPEADTDLDVDIPEAGIADDGMITAPRSQSMMGAEVDPADKTSVENIVETVENGATVNSIDDHVIGEATSHEGDGGADHLVYVDVSEEADLAAERIAFGAGSLTVERGGDLQYDYTLAGLREAVAARVAAMAD